MTYKRETRVHYEILSSMVTPTRKCGSVFKPSLQFFYKYRNEECTLTKYEQFSKFALDKFLVNV